MRDDITTVEAAKKAGVTTATIRRWIVDFGIGKKIGGRWKVSTSALNKVQSGVLYYANQGRPRKD